MHLINNESSMASALASLRNPWLTRRLALLRDRLHAADCAVGELGPIIIVEPHDTLTAVESAAGVQIVSDGWESFEVEHGWGEVSFVASDFGEGAVLFIPDRDEIDPALLAIVRTANFDRLDIDHVGDQPQAEGNHPA